MNRLLFSKTGNAVWISHLDLMRVFQRAFRRGGMLLKHSQGYTPHPCLSIAMPLSVGIGSTCELLDFELDDNDSTELSLIPEKLNATLPDGIHVKQCYSDGRKLKELCWLETELTLEYDSGFDAALVRKITDLFERSSLNVEKHGKNGNTTVDIIPMIHTLDVRAESNLILLHATVAAQNPTLNPMLLAAAIERELPESKPDFVKYLRIEVYDSELRCFR